MKNTTNSRPVLPDSVTLMPGAYLAPGTVIEENVLIGPNAVVLAGRAAETGKITTIKAGAEIGANATILAGLTIGMRARIAPGAVVTCSVPPLAIVEGNPARISGYVETTGNRGGAPHKPDLAAVGVVQSRVAGVAFHVLPLVPDLRGNLSVGEFEREIPFKPLRYFLVFGVPTAETRGEHAHLRCKQFLVAVRGSLSVVVDDGNSREEFVLDRPNVGLYLSQMVWGIQYRYSADAILLVFASEYYDPSDYIRDYSAFLSLAEKRRERE